MALDVALPEADRLDDPLPAELRLRRGLTGLDDALRKVHQPDTRDDVRRARDRLRYDEAFVLQTVLARRRAETTRRSRRPPGCRGAGGLLDAFDDRLPFTLTDGQREVAAAVAADLAREHPMHRLLQGEVGSGKTVVPCARCSPWSTAGGQAALLAPTEVLAAAAPPLDHGDARPAGRARPARRLRHRAPGSRCSPARRRPPPGDQACSTSSAATPAS